MASAVAASPVTVIRASRTQMTTPPVGQVKTFLQNRLSPEDYQRLCQMMEALNSGGQEGPSGNHYDPPDSVPDEQAEDEPAPFSGRPRPGGKMGQDARGSSYLDNFPSNALVDVNNYGQR
jgi:hypothetical protein